MRALTYCAVAAVVFSVGALTGVRADEEKVPIDKLPRAVVDAVKKRFPEAEIVSASKEVEDGKTLYEVALKQKDLKMDVTLTAEGAIQEIEKEIVAKDLPKAIADSLDAKYPKATIKKAEEIIKVKDGKEKLESYEILLVTGEKKTLEVVLSPDGKVTKEEDKTEKKKEKDK